MRAPAGSAFGDAAEVWLGGLTCFRNPAHGLTSVRGDNRGGQGRAALQYTKKAVRSCGNSEVTVTTQVRALPVFAERQLVRSLACGRCSDFASVFESHTYRPPNQIPDKARLAPATMVSAPYWIFGRATSASPCHDPTCPTSVKHRANGTSKPAGRLEPNSPIVFAGADSSHRAIRVSNADSQPHLFVD